MIIRTASGANAKLECQYKRRLSKGSKKISFKKGFYSLKW